MNRFTLLRELQSEEIVNRSVKTKTKSDAKRDSVR